MSYGVTVAPDFDSVCQVRILVAQLKRALILRALLVCSNRLRINFWLAKELASVSR